MRILVLSAFETELKNVISNFESIELKIISKRKGYYVQQNNNQIFFSYTGLGTASSAATTTALCEVFKPDVIVMCGVAGGLEEGQQIGDLIIAKKVVDADLYASQKLLKDTPYEECLTDPHTQIPIKFVHESNPIFIELIQSIILKRLKEGIIITSNIFPAPKDLLNEIFKVKPSAIEMESSGVYKAAEFYNVPVLAIRAISNLLNSDGNDLGTTHKNIAMCSERLAEAILAIIKNISLLKYPLCSKRIDATTIITKYDLKPHPEGGWYRQTFCSKDLIEVKEDLIENKPKRERPAGTAIIYLLSNGDFSAWHTLQSDETWHFYDGSPLILRIIEPNSKKIEEVILSRNLFQYTIRAGFIFSAETLGCYSLLGCVVTPGFNFDDFKLIGSSYFNKHFPQNAKVLKYVREMPQIEIIDMKYKGIKTSFFNKNKILETKLSEEEETNRNLFLRSKL